MYVPLELSYRNVEKTESLEQTIREQVEKLERVCDHISSCRVAVEKTGGHLQSGSPYRVRVDVNVPPSHELVARSELGKGNMHQDVEAIVRDVFGEVRRQVKEINERQHGHAKVHPQQQAVALVDRIFQDQDYGFLRTVDGQEVYFHRNSVLHGDFDRLEAGTGVNLMMEMGSNGLQATSVRVVDKPGARPKE